MEKLSAIEILRKLVSFPTVSNTSNLELVKKIAGKYVGVAKESLSYSIESIIDILPHRYPFLMIDRIIKFHLEYNSDYSFNHVPAMNNNYVDYNYLKDLIHYSAAKSLGDTISYLD